MRINIAYVGRAPPSVTNPHLRWAEPGHWRGKRNSMTHVWPQGDQPSTGGCGPSWHCHILAQCHSATFEKAGPCLLQESNQPKPRKPCFAKCTASTLMPVMCQFLVNFCFILFYYKKNCTGKIPGKPAQEAPRAVGGPGCSGGGGARGPGGWDFTGGCSGVP